MSSGLGKLFQKNKQTTIVSKYLKQTSPDTIGDGMEGAGHLSQSIEKREAFVPAVDYSNPENFVKYGSAKKYYDDSMAYIANYYPYDGSAFEKVKFYNDLNELEKYVFDEEYPRSTGYVVFNPSWGTVTHTAGGYSSASATPSQYIQVKGGPHSGTIFSTTQQRTSNLEFGGLSGSTVEFFYKKNEGMPNSSAQGQKQVVFDLWNGSASGSSDYGRLRVEVFSGSEDRFHVTMLSGTKGFFTQSVPTTGGLSYLCSGSWHHYAFAFDTSPAIPSLDFYVDGVCAETQITASGHQAGRVSLVTGSLIANLGSLRAAPSGNAFHEASMEGYGKLSASIDEFRFWKKERTAQHIGRNWFTQVDGGSNKYDANKDLGVYFKFNEGIVGSAATDKIVLDYSGRISNGSFVNYNTNYSRNLGSAINDLSLTSVFEAKDPIIRKTNTNYTTKLNELSLSGSTYDYNNSARLINQVPYWIQEEDESGDGELKSLVQILSSYFDTLHLQIDELSKVKDVKYLSGSISGSAKEFPYVDRLLDNHGLETPEIFANISALGQFRQRDEQINFEQTLVNTKNLIYKNIYNNLSFIYKSKGSPKAIRNFIRCLGVGENIIALNTYANNTEYFLTSSYKAESSPKKYVDFSGLSRITDGAATVYQYYDSTNPASFGIINGSGSSTNLHEFAFTLEGEFIFPNKDNSEKLSFVPSFPVTSSLFGFHTPKEVTPTSTNLTWKPASDDFGLQVYALKSPAPFAEVISPLSEVKDAYFVVQDRAGTVLVTSSIYANIYDNKKWNVAVSVRPKKYPFAQGVTGTLFAGGNALEYELELYGTSYNGGIKEHSFSSVTDLTYTKGSSIINNAKRIYAGAERTNFNGAVAQRSDIRASSIRYWTDYLSNQTIDLHAKESYSSGRIYPYRNTYEFQNSKPNVYIPKIQTLAMNWDFANLSGSDNSGQFIVSDYSSGSVGAGYISNYQNGTDSTFSDINLRQHTGRGDIFDADSQVIKKQYVYTEKLQVPDYAISDEMVKVLAADEKFFNITHRPEDLFFAVEKSVYRSISERMLQLFSSIAEFSSLIGEPVNKYRHQYKNLEKFREIFYRNVEDEPDFEKYLKFYKWLDIAMGEMIEQLMPASAAHADSVRTIIENHMLERPKVKYNYPGAYKTSYPSPSGTIRNLGAICRDEPGWKYNHSPVGGIDQTKNCWWWKNTATRTNSPLYYKVPTNQASVSTSRIAFHNARKRELTGSRLVCLGADLQIPNVGGINQKVNRRRNVRDVTFSNFEGGEDCTDVLDPNKKSKMTYTATKLSEATSYTGDLISPFTAVSSSNNNLGGYQQDLKVASLNHVIITNLHEDSVHPFDNSVPMQGPFTERWVGGFQSRHVAPLISSSVDLDPTLGYGTGLRKESNRLLLGGGKIYVESIITGSIPKGHYLRGLGSKSPVNIENIKTFTGSLVYNSTQYDGVNPIGNYSLNYEIVQASGREPNLDLAKNTGSFMSQGKFFVTPSAFLTSIPDSNWSVGANRNRKVFGAYEREHTGSGVYPDRTDYPAPRQRAGKKTTKSIFVSRFASPGSTMDSKQQFRDVATDQKSSNNALPFRNIPVRQAYNSQLGPYAGWGGFSGSTGIDQLALYGAKYLSDLNNGVPFTVGASTIIPASASIHKTQRNTLETIRIYQTDATAPGAAGVDVTWHTASLRDNGFVTHPIPRADRSQWFMALSGTDGPAYSGHISPAGTFTTFPGVWGAPLFDEYVLSSSHYPANIPVLPVSYSLDTAVAASSEITVTGFNPATWNGKTIELRDAHGVTVGFTGSSGIALGSAARSSAASWQFGVQSAGSNIQVAGSLSTAITFASMETPPDLRVVVAYTAGTDKFTLTQKRKGEVGNTNIGGTAAGSGLISTSPTNKFGGGQNAFYHQFGGAAYTGSSGKVELIWDQFPAVAPWTQTRSGQLPAAQFFQKNNIYEIPIRENAQYDSLNARTYVDRAGNSITYNSLGSYREPPITSRYKPLIHHIKTNPGTPNKTFYNRATEVSVDYSYGNYMMGFANRELNQEYQPGNNSKWYATRVKRPYEGIRDNYIDDVPSTVDGVDILRLTAYNETIYPKEIYTYLSGTRGRKAFKTNFWKSDTQVATAIGASSIGIVSLSGLANENNIKTYNRQYSRISGAFTTSMGYGMMQSDQISYNLYGGKEPYGPGSGSIWSMESYLYSDYTGSLKSITDPNGAQYLLAGASTMPCGELMMTSYGPVRKTGAPGRESRYQTGSQVSAQYIYGAPAMSQSCATTAATKAVASITSLAFPVAAVAATIVISIPSTYTDVCLDGGIMTLNDGSSGACNIVFDAGTNATPSTCGGTLGYDESGAVTVSTIATKIANSINNVYGGNFTAVANSPGAGSVTVTASPAGTAGNSYTVQWVPDSGCSAPGDSIQLNGANAPATAVAFTGGTAAISLDGQTLIVQTLGGTHTMTFKQDGTASSSTIIDVQTAGDVGAVATAIGTTITAASSGIDMAVASVAGAVVNLEASAAGTGMNGKTITGTAESGGTLSAIDFGSGAAATTACYWKVFPSSPGGVASRPRWKALRERRVIDGPNRGSLLPARTPFYNSYDEWATDVRARGQDHTIIPEYRMSALMETYQQIGSAFSFVQNTLELTGANYHNYDSSNTKFFERYSQTNTPEFISPFMGNSTDTDTLDFKFNNFPRHLQLRSDAVLKLLPYDGFFPMHRSLELGTLFSSSYSFQFSGVSGSKHLAMRSMLRPLYAPGIFYNSIKSGMAVDHPVRRVGRNEDQFNTHYAYDILGGCISGSLASPTAGMIPGDDDIPNTQRRRFTGNNPLTVGQYDAFAGTDSSNVNKFLWGDRLPFEAILSPESYLQAGNIGLAPVNNKTVLSDINEVMFYDVTGSISDISSELYKKAVSNFVAAVPEFFLKKKTNSNGSNGYLTKFVAQFGNERRATIDPLSPESSPVRSVFATQDKAYIMEVGLLKTDSFSLYNNPYAFGVPTATGSADWHLYSPIDGAAQRPPGSSWPSHRAEFAPFTPPYYYGPSVARITFMPTDGNRNYALSEIVGADATNTYIEFVNESGSYYDFALGEYIDMNNTSVSTTGTPPYGWNRAWQNRMDLDASISLTNVFPVDNGYVSPQDPNKWVIMPKWECPILDFPNRETTRPDQNQYSFSSSVDPGSFDSVEAGTQGMWHQYGIMPQNNKGVFLYIKDVDLKETEYRLVGNPAAGGSSTGTRTEVLKVPKFVAESGRSVASLGDLVGFDSDEIMRGGFDPSKAKRMGSLAEDGEKELAEAVIAMPYYLDNENNPRFMTLQANPIQLGPKIKEFRRVFTKYSLPPSLANNLHSMLPNNYPNVPSYINPFGDDQYDVANLGEGIGDGGDLLETPVVYLLEHAVKLSRQDLADIWQGLLPDIGESLQTSVTAIDHYMPGEKVETNPTVFPEIIQKQLELNLPTNGHPRVDLLDISQIPSLNGYNTTIKWLVFKVKKRGCPTYTNFVSKEVNGYEYIEQPVDLGSPGGEPNDLPGNREKSILAYQTNNAVTEPTYNWPYDYCSLIELDKISTKAVFRPDLNKEVQEYEALQNLRFNPPPSNTGTPGINEGARSSLENRQVSQDQQRRLEEAGEGLVEDYRDPRLPRP
jgi:hypothetical protein